MRSCSATFTGIISRGLPFLFLHYMYMEPRRRPLKIVGPPGVENRVMLIFRAMYADTAEEPLPSASNSSRSSPGKSCSSTACGSRHSRRPIRSIRRRWDLKSGQTAGRSCTPGTAAGRRISLRIRAMRIYSYASAAFSRRAWRRIWIIRASRKIAGRFGAKRIVLTHLGQEVLRRRERVEAGNGP